MNRAVTQRPFWTLLLEKIEIFSVNEKITQVPRLDRTEDENLLSLNQTALNSHI